MGTNTKPSRKKALLGCSLFFIIAMMVSIAFVTCLIGDSETTDITAEVRFKGTEFTVRNQDSFDWNNVKLVLNDDYTYKISKIKSKASFTIGVTQFTKKDGTKFNPFTTKPTYFSISAEDSEGSQGWWYGGWE